MNKQGIFQDFILYKWNKMKLKWKIFLLVFKNEIKGDTNDLFYISFL
jgi:hypothetical protein